MSPLEKRASLITIWLNIRFLNENIKIYVKDTHQTVMPSRYFLTGNKILSKGVFVCVEEEH